MPKIKQTPPPVSETGEAIHHLNDKAFKKIFLVKATALEYIHKFFPVLETYVELDSMETFNTNYVDKKFDEYFSDVVYRTYLKESPLEAKKKGKKKKKITVVLLFEHKKEVRSYFLLFLQLLEYIIFIWRQDLANGNKPSIIIPIVVNQGPRVLKMKMLHECFKGVPQELLNHIPNFHIHLTNVLPLTGEELLDLDEEGLLRSLFLAYVFVEDRNRVHDMLTKIFTFLKHQPEKFDFFEHIFAFVTQKGYISREEIDELLEKYLSPQQKEGAMTSVQEWKMEGEMEGKVKGKIEEKRLMVLRGKWKSASVDFLADQSELPLEDVKNLFKGYNEVLAFWKKNKNATTVYFHTKHLTDVEVKYLLDLFNKHNGSAL